MGGCSSTPKPKKEELREQRVKSFKKLDDRRCYLEIDLENIKANMRNMGQQAEEIMPVLSHDAYGHGAVQVAQLACSVDVKAFSVSSLKEAVELREGGITADIARILVMGEPLKNSLAVYSAFGLGIIVTCRRTADNLIEWAKLYEGRRRLLAYVLVDSGNTGLGLPARDVAKCVTQLKKKGDGTIRFCGLVVRNVDDRMSIEVEHRGDNTFTLNVFSDVVKKLEEREIKIPAIIFEKNQALLYEWDQTARTIGPFLKDTKVFARCGLDTFGFSTTGEDGHALRTALSMKAQVRDIRKVWRGEWVGLGDGWQAPIDSFVAVISCGFADGYPMLSNGQAKQVHVRIGGESYNIVGDVCSDHFLVHLGSSNVDPSVNVGDYATLFGPQTQDPDNQDFLELSRIGQVSPTPMLCHLSAALDKQWKSTSLTRRNTLTKMSKKSR